MRSCAGSLAPGSRSHPAARSPRSWRSRAFQFSTPIRSFMWRGFSRAGKAPARLCRPRWFLSARTDRLMSRSPKEHGWHRGARRGFLNSGMIHGGVGGAPLRSTNQRWIGFHSRPGQSLLLAIAARRALMPFGKLILSGSCRSAMLYVLTCARLVPYAAILGRS